jgi:hypothetical protein
MVTRRSGMTLVTFCNYLNTDRNWPEAVKHTGTAHSTPNPAGASTPDVIHSRDGTEPWPAAGDAVLEFDGPDRATFLPGELIELAPVTWHEREQRRAAGARGRS